MTREAKGTLSTPVAFKVDGKPYGLELDANGYLKVALPAAGSGLIGSHGYIGGAWQKNPMLLGFSGRIKELFQFVSTGAASSFALSTTPPVGEIHIISFISAFHNDPAARDVLINLSDGVDQFSMLKQAGAVAYDRVITDAQTVIVNGDKISIQCVNLAAGKIIYGVFWGYRVDIDL